MIDFAKMIDETRIVTLKSSTKDEALRELVEVLATSPTVTDKEDLMRAVFEREKLMSTGLGIEVALPHVKIASVKDFVIAVGISPEGIDFDSLDEQPVRIIVMIGANDKQAGEFLKVLAQLVLKLKNKEFRKSMLTATSTRRIKELFAAPASASFSDE